MHVRLLVLVHTTILLLHVFVSLSEHITCANVEGARGLHPNTLVARTNYSVYHDETFLYVINLKMKLIKL